MPLEPRFKVLRTEIRPKALGFAMGFALAPASFEDCSLETSEAQRVLRIDRQSRRVNGDAGMQRV